MIKASERERTIRSKINSPDVFEKNSHTTPTDAACKKSAFVLIEDLNLKRDEFNSHTCKDSNPRNFN